MVIAFSVLNKKRQRNPNTDFTVLSTCRKMLSRTGILSESCVQISRIKISNIFVRIAFMLPLNLSLVVITAFCLEEGFNLKRIAVAVGLALGIIQMDLIFFCLAYQEPSTTKILANFQRIVEQRYLSSTDSRDIYKDVEKRNEKLANLCLRFAIISEISFFGTPFLYPIGYAMLNFPTPEFWKLPFPSKWVIDLETCTGFYTALIPQATTGIIYLTLIITLVILQGGMCSYIEAFTSDLDNVVSQMNEFITLNGRQTMAKLFLEETITMHNIILRMRENVQQMMAAPIFFQLLVFTIFIAFGLLSLEQGVQDVSFEIIQSLNCLIAQLYLNYKFCSFADNMSRRTSGVADIIYNSCWYKLPIEHRKMLPLIICRAQVPFYLNGFKLLNCSLYSFQKFIRESVSFFLVFRQLRGID